MKITDEMIKRAADRAIREMIQEKLALNEYYASNRKDFVDSASDLVGQIIENLALAGYCYAVNGYHSLLKHWVNAELFTHVHRIVTDKIKSNNGFDARVKAIKEAFLTKNAFSNISKYYLSKLDKEQFEYDSDIIKNIDNYVLAKINDLINVIASGDTNILREFCQSIIDEIEENSTWNMAWYDA